MKHPDHEAWRLLETDVWHHRRFVAPIAFFDEQDDAETVIEQVTAILRDIDRLTMRRYGLYRDLISLPFLMIKACKMKRDKPEKKQSTAKPTKPDLAKLAELLLREGTKDAVQHTGERDRSGTQSEDEEAAGGDRVLGLPALEPIRDELKRVRPGVPEGIPTGQGSTEPVEREVALGGEAGERAEAVSGGERCAGCDDRGWVISEEEDLITCPDCGGKSRRQQ